MPECAAEKNMPLSLVYQNLLKSKWLSVLCLLGLGLLPVPAQSLSSLGEAPDWSVWQRYALSFDRVAALRDMHLIYVPHADLRPWIMFEQDRLKVLKENGGSEYLSFLCAPDSPSLHKPHYFKKLSEHVGTAQQPLKGLRIALDPGHIGGDFAQMEHRWFRISETDIPVVEGAMNLRVAQKLKPELEALGAEVFLLRQGAQPVTDQRPADFLETARHLLMQGSSVEPADAPSQWQINALANKLFYRVSEIRARAQLVNERVKPDFVLAIHFNAAPWEDPNQLSLSDENHTHVLVNGAYTADELALDDMRAEMLERFAQGIHLEEIPLAKALARSLAKHTGLPPFVYRGENAVQIHDEPHLWARNLIANRLYQCPVIYLEPYCMNNTDVYARVQAGDYAGLQVVNGQARISLYEEYKEAVLAGLRDYFERNLSE